MHARERVVHLYTYTYIYITSIAAILQEKFDEKRKKDFLRDTHVYNFSPFVRLFFVLRKSRNTCSSFPLIPTRYLTRNDERREDRAVPILVEEEEKNDRREFGRHAEIRRTPTDVSLVGQGT